MDLCLARHLCIFPSCQQKSHYVNNLSVSALGSLLLPAMRYVSAAQSYLFSLRVSVCVTVIKTSNVHVDLDP